MKKKNHAHGFSPESQIQMAEFRVTGIFHSKKNPLYLKRATTNESARCGDGKPGKGVTSVGVALLARALHRFVLVGTGNLIAQ